VLAHEIAHIQRHDFLTWLTAQVALTLHFYHPLVHWLCGRLRLEQELAADAAAARFAGGRQAYLTTLAAMALRQADRPLAWPARTFLPTRGTFMRRIDMLRDAKPGSTTPSVGLRVGTVVVLLAAGLFAAGFRGINGPADAADDGRIAGAVAGAATTTADEPASLAYVPRDAVMVAMLRPAKLLKQPAFAQLATAFERMGMSRDEAETLKRIEQVSLVFLLQENPQGQTLPNPSGSILRLADAADAQALAKKLVPNAVEEEYGNHTYFKNPNGSSDGYCYYFVDEKTFLIGKETGIRRMIIAGATGASKAKWAAAWNYVASGDGALLVNVGGVFAEWDKALRSSTSPNGPVPLLNSFAPLWQNTEVITLAMSSDENLTLLANLLCGSADDAKKVQETITAVITLAKNSLSQARAAAARVPGKEGAGRLGAVDFAGSILDEIRLGRKDGQVEIAARVPARDAATAVSRLVPAVTHARSAARQTQSKNNLKQIGLAMHIYHDTYRKFPPAVLYGPDGKTPYSWRVALLPFLDQANLYQQYRFNEPWDSENNRKVLAQMPPVYRDPNEPGTLTHSSYFVLTGQDTVFDGKEGTEILQIKDGMSNTILVVEAQRDIPWTKPEDIPYAADKPLPKFGGHYPDGFQALLCNGSVRFIPAKLNEKTMRSLFTKGAGEPIIHDDLGPAR
jgi:hypothetical protein